MTMFICKFCSNSIEDSKSVINMFLVDFPPSYMESVFGKVDGIENDKEVIDGNQYAPMYQYYRFPNE